MFLLELHGPRSDISIRVCSPNSYMVSFIDRCDVTAVRRFCLWLEGVQGRSSELAQGVSVLARAEGSTCIAQCPYLTSSSLLPCSRKVLAGPTNPQTASIIPSSIARHQNRRMIKICRINGSLFFCYYCVNSLIWSVWIVIVVRFRVFRNMRLQGVDFKINKIL